MLHLGTEFGVTAAVCEIPRVDYEVGGGERGKCAMSIGEKENAG